jgi:DNA-binding PadR family transcriptional regulator
MMQETVHLVPPQAVPRGFLAAYMLAMISREDQNGYSLMQSISEKSKGAWRPGPGAIYPMLKSLSKEGLIKPLSPTARRQRKSRTNYYITEKGKERLDEWRKSITEGLKGDYGIRTILTELYSPPEIISLQIEHMEMEYELIFEKIAQLSRSEREEALKKMKELIEAQLSKIDFKKNKIHPHSG